MLTITTKQVYGRDDWYMARADIKGRTFVAWEVSRTKALMTVLAELTAHGLTANLLTV